MAVYHGSCLCKTVQFTISGEPFTYYVCHCQNCRKASGTAFMSNAFFKPEQVTMTHGSDQVKVYRDQDTRSGDALLRSFCPECGSCLFLGGEKKSYTIVATGSIEEEVDWVPRGQSFPECKRLWVEGIKTSPKRQSKL